MKGATGARPTLQPGRRVWHAALLAKPTAGLQGCMGVAAVPLGIAGGPWRPLHRRGRWKGLLGWQQQVLSGQQQQLLLLLEWQRPLLLLEWQRRRRLACWRQAYGASWRGR